MQYENPQLTRKMMKLIQEPNFKQCHPRAVVTCNNVQPVNAFICSITQKHDLAMSDGVRLWMDGTAPT